MALSGRLEVVAHRREKEAAHPLGGGARVDGSLLRAGELAEDAAHLVGGAQQRGRPTRSARRRGCDRRAARRPRRWPRARASRAPRRRRRRGRRGRRPPRPERRPRARAPGRGPRRRWDAPSRSEPRRGRRSAGPTCGSAPSSSRVTAKSALDRETSTSNPCRCAASMAALRPRGSPSTVSKTPCASSAASSSRDDDSNARRCACTSSDAPSATKATGATTAMTRRWRRRAVRRARVSRSSTASRDADDRDQLHGPRHRRAQGHVGGQGGQRWPWSWPGAPARTACRGRWWRGGGASASVATPTTSVPVRSSATRRAGVA